MKIKVLSKKEVVAKKGKEITFYRYFTPVEIEVIDTNGNSLGIQQKNLSVHFTTDASKLLDDDKVFAVFDGDSEQISLPFQYRIPKDVTDEEEHKKNYVWIRGWKAMKKIPFKGKQSTCKPILDDEEETEETSID